MSNIPSHAAARRPQMATGGPRFGPPVQLTLNVYQIMGEPPRERRYASGPGGLWVDVPGRHHPYYVCSAGVEHARWWQMHQPGGTYPVFRRCTEHEVTEMLDPNMLRIP